MRWGLVKVDIWMRTAKIVKDKRFPSKQKAQEYINGMHSHMGGHGRNPDVTHYPIFLD